MPVASQAPICGFAQWCARIRTAIETNDIVNGTFGVKYKPTDRMEIGIAWENRLTDRRDVLDNRLSVDWILRY